VVVVKALTTMSSTSSKPLEPHKPVQAEAASRRREYQRDFFGHPIGVACDLRVWSDRCPPSGCCRRESAGNTRSVPAFRPLSGNPKALARRKVNLSIRAPA
jgi:hypothetical protein